jgi:hypothetical protein
MPRRMESLFLAGPEGRLEALLEEPESEAPVEAAVVCHPHPQFGGTMHNKVVYRLARGLRKSGCVVLRFNFRGVNLSEGEYADGIGETEDARVALRELQARYPELPVLAAGFSFGSRVALRLASQEPVIRRVIAVGFPTRMEERDFDIASPFRNRLCKAPTMNSARDRSLRPSLKPSRSRRICTGLPQPITSSKTTWMDLRR